MGPFFFELLIDSLDFVQLAPGEMGLVSLGRQAGAALFKDLQVFFLGFEGLIRFWSKARVGPCERGPRLSAMRKSAPPSSLEATEEQGLAYSFDTCFRSPCPKGSYLQWLSWFESIDFESDAPPGLRCSADSEGEPLFDFMDSEQGTKESSSPETSFRWSSLDPEHSFSYMQSQSLPLTKMDYPDDSWNTWT
ncbi:hypothetical protein Ancab_020308 [Ancistrocladus abbreviatus]